MKVVCDTNVLVSAAIRPNGLASQLLLRVLQDHLLITSAPMLAEVLDVMRRPSIQALHRRDERGIRRVVARLFKLSSFVPIVNWKSGLVPQDPKDDQIVLTAIVGHADMLCSRDRHLFHPDVLALCSQHGIRVVKDKDLLAELQST